MIIDQIRAMHDEWEMLALPIQQKRQSWLAQALVSAQMPQEMMPEEPQLGLPVRFADRLMEALLEPIDSVPLLRSLESLQLRLLPWHADPQAYGRWSRAQDALLQEQLQALKQFPMTGWTSKNLCSENQAVGISLARKITEQFKSLGEISLGAGFGACEDLHLQTLGLDSDWFRELRQKLRALDLEYQQETSEPELSSNWWLPFQIDNCGFGLQNRAENTLCHDFLEILGLNHEELLATAPRKSVLPFQWCQNRLDSRQVAVLRAADPLGGSLSARLDLLGQALCLSGQDPEASVILREQHDNPIPLALGKLFSRRAMDPDWLKLLGTRVPQTAEIGDARKKSRDLIRRLLLVMDIQEQLHANQKGDPTENIKSLLTEWGLEPTPILQHWMFWPEFSALRPQAEIQLLGELLSWQLEDALSRDCAGLPLSGPDAGGWLIENIFESLDHETWDECIARSCGQPANLQQLKKQLYQ